MTKTLLHLVFLFLSFTGFTQDYAYSFTGELATDDQYTLIDMCEKSAYIDRIKLKYKEDKKSGEILIWITPAQVVGEVESSFSPIDIKSAFISLGVVPKEFRTLNTK